MKLNTLALAIMLLTGSGIAEAVAAEAAPEAPDSVSLNVQPEPPVSAVTQQERATQPQPGQETRVEDVTVSPEKQNAHQPPETLSPGETGLPFTPEQEARIGEVAKAYLLDHPELLLEVDGKLQKIQFDEEMKTRVAAVLHHQDELTDDRTAPAIGPENAKVAVIEFFDYQCSVCVHQAPIIRSVMKQNPQVRFFFREWPIFGYRWKLSFKAAETGLRIWQQKGGDAYMKYHYALFASGHTEGALTQKDITQAASSAGKLKSQEVLEVLSGTDILAKNVGFQGTPGIVVMPVKEATAGKITIFPGGATPSMLQEAIDKASAQAGN